MFTVSSLFFRLKPYVATECLQASRPRHVFHIPTDCWSCIEYLQLGVSSTRRISIYCNVKPTLRTPPSNYVISSTFKSGWSLWHEIV